MKRIMLFCVAIGLMSGLLIWQMTLHKQLTTDKKVKLTDIDSIEDNEQEITQKVLFVYEYTNYAWEYQHQVIFIDNEGNIKEYAYTGDLGDAKQENWQQETAKELVEANYAKAKTVTGRVDKAELRKVYQLSKKVKENEYSEKVSGGADRRQSTTYCYVLEGNAYKIIELGTTGDWISRNLDPVAITIDFWLRCDVFGQDRSYLEQQYDYEPNY